MSPFHHLSFISLPTRSIFSKQAIFLFIFITVYIYLHIQVSFVHLHLLTIHNQTSLITPIHPSYCSAHFHLHSFHILVLLTFILQYNQLILAHYLHLCVLRFLSGHFFFLNPTYCPFFDGYFVLISFSTHLGNSFLFPAPNFPYNREAACRYALNLFASCVNVGWFTSR